MSSLEMLPPNLPVPVDDGACAHLVGMRFPQIILSSTSGDRVVPGRLPGWAVFYIFTMMGKPGVPLPDGWEDIPGARGCTPQSCAFCDHREDFAQYGCAVYGLSSQSTGDQTEAKNRLKLPFDLLSDPSLDLARSLDLPTFEVRMAKARRRLFRRVTLITYNAIIKKAFYPVFPPDKNAEEVLAWLKENV